MKLLLRRTLLRSYRLLSLLMVTTAINHSFIQRS
jgi:hypothetical protein